jgi:hypothetical protein
VQRLVWVGVHATHVSCFGLDGLRSQTLSDGQSVSATHPTHWCGSFVVSHARFGAVLQSELVTQGSAWHWPALPSVLEHVLPLGQLSTPAMDLHPGTHSPVETWLVSQSSPAFAPQSESEPHPHTPMLTTQTGRVGLVGHTFALVMEHSVHEPARELDKGWQAGFAGSGQLPGGGLGVE